MKIRLTKLSQSIRESASAAFTIVSRALVLISNLFRLAASTRCACILLTSGLKQRVCFGGGGVGNLALSKPVIIRSFCGWIRGTKSALGFT